MTARELSIGAGRVDDGERTVDSRSVELMTARELSIGAGRVDDGERTVDSRSVELMTARELSTIDRCWSS